VGAAAPGIIGLIADKIGLSSALKLSILPLGLAVLLLFYLIYLKRK
jgi:hypothetical protein